MCGVRLGRWRQRGRTGEAGGRVGRRGMDKGGLKAGEGGQAGKGWAEAVWGWVECRRGGREGRGGLVGKTEGCIVRQHVGGAEFERQARAARLGERKGEQD